MTRKWGATTPEWNAYFFATWQDIATQSTILISKVGRIVSPKLAGKAAGPVTGFGNKTATSPKNIRSSCAVQAPYLHPTIIYP